MKPYYDHAGITIYHGDCLEIMLELDKVDLVLTDPPYGINYQTNWRKISMKPDVLSGDLNPPLHSISLIAEILKDGGALYLATRFDVSHLWRSAIANNFLKEKTPIYWDKGNHTSGDLEGDYGGRVEIFIFCHKGRHLLRSRQSNLWSIPRDSSGDHPTPKPVSLMRRMIENSSDIDDLVLDPFVGSGTTLVAAKELGRKAIGIEIEERYCEIAAKRLSQEILQF